MATHGDTVEMTAALATKELKAAIESLIDPQVWFDNASGAVRKVDSLYRRVRTGLDRKGDRGRSAAGSRPPADLHGIDFLRRVDHTVRVDWSSGGGTEYGLRVLAEASYAPDDVAMLLTRHRMVLSWVAEASDIVGDAERPVPIRKPCPVCGRLFSYDGDGLRKWALTVTSAGAHCRCGASWDFDRLPLLARLLEA